MKHFITILLSVLLFSNFAFAASTAIGNGYSCDSGQVLLNGNKISKSSAKKKINRQLVLLQAQLTVSSGKKAKNLQRKINKLIATRKKVIACKLVVAQVFKNMLGEYTGTWQNTTFGSSGPISAEFRLSAAQLEVTLDIGGFMFGALNPDPFQFTVNVAGASFPKTFTIIGTPIGDLQILFYANGSFSVTEINVPGFSFVQGANLNASKTSNGFSGNFASFLAGNVQLAQGTIALVKQP